MRPEWGGFEICNYVPKSGCVLCIHSASLFVMPCELLTVLFAFLFVGYLGHKSLGSSKFQKFLYFKFGFLRLLFKRRTWRLVTQVVVRFDAVYIGFSYFNMGWGTHNNFCYGDSRSWSSKSPDV